MADLMEALEMGLLAPLVGPIFSNFMQFSGEMAKIISLPFRFWVPPGKSWIRHCNVQYVSKLLVHQEYTDTRWPVTKFAKWSCLSQKRKVLDRLSRIMMI